MVPITVVFPEAVKQQGNTSVLFVQAVATPTAPDISSEITAGTTVNVSCYLYTGGVVTSTQNRGAAPRRLCTVQELQQFGTLTTEISDIQYVYNPQATSSDPANVAKTALVADSDWFMIQRKGLSAINTAYTAGQKVTVTKVRLGVQNLGVTGDGEFDEFAITQGLIALSPPVEGTLVA